MLHARIGATSAELRCDEICKRLGLEEKKSTAKFLLRSRSERFPRFAGALAGDEEEDVGTGAELAGSGPGTRGSCAVEVRGAAAVSDLAGDGQGRRGPYVR